MNDRTIRKWSESGMPKKSYGKWNLGECILWWAENIWGGIENEETQDARAEYWGYKARVEKIKAEQAEESVIKKEDFIDAWCWRVSEMSANLGAIPNRLSPLLVMKEEARIRAILETEIWKIRDAYSRSGKFFPAKGRKK